MFRAVPCSSSGGQIVLLQHLVSSLSVNGCIVCRLRADSALNWHTIQPFAASDDTRCCSNTIWSPEDEHGTAWNMSRIIMYHICCYRIKELCIKLVIETSLYYDAQSEKHEIDKYCLHICGACSLVPDVSICTVVAAARTSRQINLSYFHLTSYIMSWHSSFMLTWIYNIVLYYFMWSFITWSIALT